MKKYISIVAVAILMFAACKPGDFGDVNTNPYSLSKISTRSMLTNVLQNLPGTAFGITTANFYAQYLSEGPYPGGSLYNAKNFDFNGMYSGPLFDLQKIIDKNSGTPITGIELSSEPGADGAPANQIAVARILKAYYFWWMTDRWGDIPYSEALKGSANFTPKYDKQQDIYTALFKEFKDAAAQIQPTQTGVGGDILFHGDMNSWKTFANTCRLMMALRLNKAANAATGSAEFNAAVTSGVINSVDEDVRYNYLAGDPNNYNPFYANYTVGLRNDYAISKTLVDYMSPKGDARLKVYGEVLPSGNVVGLSYGSSAARNIPNVYSRVGDKFRGAGSPALIFSYAQVLFAKAEAAKMGWLPGGDVAAAAFYNDAIKASFDTYGVSSGYTAYISNPDVVYNPTTGLSQIMTEKWVHLYLNGYEAWTDWRRTGFPVLTPAPDAVDPRGIPVRQGYGTNEKTINAASYNEAVARQGADDNYTKIWWNK